MPETERERAGYGLIFDVDGVIIDSNPVHTETWLTYLQRCGIQPAENWEQKMYGRRNDDIVRALISERLSEPEICAHGAAKEALYREIMRPQIARWLVPGVAAFIAGQNGRPMAVASNAEPANVDFVLNAAGLRGRFRVVVDGHQVERPKPAPDVYLLAAELLRMPPARCIVFEDSPAGVEAARGAGMRVVGVETTYRDLNVDLSVKDFTRPELESWLHSLMARAA